MVEVPAVAHLISTEMFRFRSIEQLMSLANTNVELPGNIVDPQGGGHTPDDDMHSKFNVGVSSGGNPAEGGEDPMEPSDAEETIASHEHT
ncbi:unnamed protein product [Brassica rapa]|uniref:Uncharacterized protein n=1 Tax=Brassica campestris TaxID=3711 RepID=A0A8D9GXP2_BRACM|nr:unnamed protein product [Brassica rapa]CAG7888990.1 unnamed protein product [Brassica rapa]